MKLLMKAEVYAIRNKHTGLYLPDRQGRGYSNDEPTSPARPRLFWKLTSARMALRAWLKGRWLCKKSGGYSIADSFGYEYDEEIKIIPVESRKAEDMEIVVFSLVEQDAA